MSTALASKREIEKFLESLLDKHTKKLKPFLESGKTLTKEQLAKALKEAGVELDDDSKGKMHAALAKVMGKKQKPAATDDDSDPEDDDDAEDGEMGDPSLDGILEPDDDEDDDEEEDDMGEDDEDDEIGAQGADLIGGEGKRKKESARVKQLLAENKALKLKEQARSLRETAKSLVAEAKVPAALRKDVYTYLIEQCRSEKAMRAYLGTMKPIFTESGTVVGNVARTREFGASGSGLMTVSGVEKG